MAEFAVIALKDIAIPERLRAIEEEQALAISTSMAEHGQITPIAVRRTPNGARKFTLIAGAHRCRAAEMLDISEIDAMIFSASKDEARLLEISENVFTNILSVIDRAMFVAAYRETWEKVNGPVNPQGGRPSKKLVQNAPVSPLGILEEEAAKGFGAHCARRLGISKDSVKRLALIARMDRGLREQLRGRAEADQQGQLLRLARLGPDEQARISAAMRVTGDLGRALEAVNPDAPQPSAQQKVLSTLIAAWSRADAETRAEFAQFMASGEPA